MVAGSLGLKFCVFVLKSKPFPKMFYLGVEMEALTGVSVALLTLYDMCKAVSKEIHISYFY